MPPAQDPFYLIRQEIQDSYNEIQQKMSRFHGLSSSHPDRKAIAQDVEAGCDSLQWQLTELGNAVERAAENPVRFNITVEELASRRKWIQTTQKQVDGTKQSIKTALAPAPYIPTAQDRAIEANSQFTMSEQQKQEHIIRVQDDSLVELGKMADNVGQMGKVISETLKEDERLLNQLDEEIDTTSTRLNATVKKMAEIIRKSSSTTQLMVIAVLIVILIILIIFVIY